MLHFAKSLIQLNQTQRKAVAEMGFEHILNFNCSTLESREVPGDMVQINQIKEACVN